MAKLKEKTTTPGAGIQALNNNGGAQVFLDDEEVIGSVHQETKKSGIEERAQAANFIGEMAAKKEEKMELKKKQAATKKTVLLTLTEDKKLSYQKLFGAQGFSLLQGIRMCLSFVYNNVKNGTLTLDESGIEFNRMRDL